MQAVPTTPKGRRTRSQILDAARTIFARDGFVNARMADIAAEAGLSMGAVYRYFENKEDVFENLIADVHEELYESSRARGHHFAEEPFAALFEANFAYLQHYSTHRDVMRVLIEASTVDQRFREIWWKMRSRHARRFTQAMHDAFGVTDIDGIETAIAADAMTCLVEQVAYVWYAHAAINDREVPLEQATETVTRAWYRLFFLPQSEAERNHAEAANALAPPLPGAERL